MVDRADSIAGEWTRHDQLAAGLQTHSVNRAIQTAAHRDKGGIGVTVGLVGFGMQPTLDRLACP